MLKAGQCPVAFTSEIDMISILKIHKGSTEPSVSPTFAVNRRLNKNEEKHQ